MALSTSQAPNVLCCLSGTNNFSLRTFELAHAASDIIQHVRWSNVVFIYENFLHQQVLINLLTQLCLGIIHIPVITEQKREWNGNLTQVNLSSTLQPLVPTFVRHVIVGVSPNLVDRVIEKAEHLGLLSERYQWLFISPVQQSLTDMAGKFRLGSHVLLLQSEETDQHFSCTKQSSESYPLISPNLSYCGYSQRLYTFSSQTENQFQPVGTWRPLKGWTQTSSTLLFPNVFKDFGNRLLIVGTIPATPFVNVRMVGNETMYDGFCIELLRALAAHLNFRYKIVQSPDNKYGATEQNGSWNGMVGMVARNEVDMGIGPYTITAVRQTVVDFSVPFIIDGGAILTKRDNSSMSFIAGLESFSRDIWLVLLAMAIGMGVLFYFVMRCSPYPKPDNVDRPSLDWSLGSCVMYIGGSFMLQGVEHYPKSASARCLLGFWGIFTTVIMSTFTATLTSVLTVDVEGSKIDSIEDLALSSVKPLVLAGSVWDTLFKNATKGSYGEIAKRMSDMPEITSENAALDLVMNGKMAFLHDVNQLSYMRAVNCKQLHLSSNIFNSNGLGIILPKNAPYKDAVNDVILRLWQGGFVSKWRSYWWPITTECEIQESSVSQPKQLGVTRLVGVLLVYGCTTITATICFLLCLCLNKVNCMQSLRKMF